MLMYSHMWYMLSHDVTYKYQCEMFDYPCISVRRVRMQYINTHGVVHRSLQCLSVSSLHLFAHTYMKVRVWLSCSIGDWCSYTSVICAASTCHSDYHAVFSSSKHRDTNPVISKYSILFFMVCAQALYNTTDCGARQEANELWDLKFILSQSL